MTTGSSAAAHVRALCRIKSKSKRHPVLAKGCLVPEEDADTDGTEIYDPEGDDDRQKRRRRRPPSKGASKRKGAPGGGPRGAKRGAKAPPRPPPSVAQYSGLVQVSAGGTLGFPGTMGGADAWLQRHTRSTAGLVCRGPRSLWPSGVCLASLVHCAGPVLSLPTERPLQFEGLP